MDLTEYLHEGDALSMMRFVEDSVRRIKIKLITRAERVNVSSVNDEVNVVSVQEVHELHPERDFSVTAGSVFYHEGAVLASLLILLVFRSWSRIFFSISASVRVSSRGHHWSASPVLRIAISTVGRGFSLKA